MPEGPPQANHAFPALKLSDPGLAGGEDDKAGTHKLSPEASRAVRMPSSDSVRLSPKRPIVQLAPANSKPERRRGCDMISCFELSQ